MMESSSRVRKTFAIVADGFGDVFGISLLKAALYQFGTNALVLNVRNYRRIDTRVPVDLDIEAKQLFIIGHVLKSIHINNKMDAPYLILGLRRLISDKMRA
jgi:hypothetical protein